MNYRELFSKTPAVKLFFLAAIPGSVGMLASALYQTIDGVLVGRILAGDAFAALNLAMPLVIINFSLADLIGVGSVSYTHLTLPTNIIRTSSHDHAVRGIGHVRDDR